jgi:outer membrane murein-binding lipoprotein Lpp
MSDKQKQSIAWVVGIAVTVGLFLLAGALANARESGTLVQQVESLREEQARQAANQTKIENEQGEMRKDVSALKQDTSSIKTDVSWIRERLSR